MPHDNQNNHNDEKPLPDLEKMPEHTRREFLRRLGGALGGVALGGAVLGGGPVFGAAGGPGRGGTGRGGRGRGVTLLAGGYTFYRVFTLGGENPFPFAPLTDINPGVMLTENNQILFHATNSQGQQGVYALNMNYDGATPSVSGGSKVVEVGDVLPADGRPVNKIAVGDTNATGSYATVLGTDNPGTQLTPPASPNISPNSSTTPTPNPGLAENNWATQSSAPASVAPPITASTVYIQKTPTSGFQPLVSLASPTPPLDDKGTQGQFGAIHGDIALQDDDSVNLVAHYSLYNADLSAQGVPIGPQARQGLFNLLRGEASDQGSLLQTTGDMLPQSGAVLTAMGLVDVSPDGYYVLQANGAHRGRGAGWGRGASRGPLHPSVLLNGHVSQPGAQAARLLAASGELRPGRSIVSGDTYLGPRVGQNNVVGHVAHVSDTAHQLIRQAGGQRSILSQTSSGLPGDDGDYTQIISPPIIGPTGIHYWAEVADDGTGNQVNHLYMSDGTTNTLLLSSLDPVNPNGFVTEIHFGYHTAQTDSAGRLVFLAEFSSTSDTSQMSDPKVITTSIVVGIPV